MGANHHFVSQVHQKMFQSPKGDYIVYSKKYAKPNRKSGTKRLFSQTNLNSTLDETGVINQENELIYKRLLEDDFISNHNKLLEGIIQRNLIDPDYHDVLAFFLSFAALHILRNPFSDSFLNNVLIGIANLPDRKAEFTEYMKSAQRAKSNEEIQKLIQPNLLKQHDRIFHSMAPANFSIMFCENSPFYLPDTTVWFDGGFGLNATKEIILPVSKSIVIHFKKASENTPSCSHIRYLNYTSLDDLESIRKANSKLYYSSIEQLIIPSMDSLNFVDLT